MSVGRYTGDGLVKIDGKIYFVGGYNSSGALKTFECYDPQTNEWEAMPELQDAREGLASAAVEGKIYAIGGVGFTSMEIFDPQTNQWSYGASLPKAIDRACALSINGRIILTGGNDGSSDLTDVYEFDPERGTWEDLPSINHARSRHRMVFYDGRAWVLGGDSAVCESYDPDSNSWEAEASLNAVRSWPVAWTNGEYIFVAGGNSLETNSIEVLREGSSEWQNSPNLLPEAKYAADSIVSNGMLFLIAGKSGGNFTNNVHTTDVTPPMDLYYREANASGTITLDKLSTDLADEFASSSAVSAPVGLVTAVDYNDECSKRPHHPRTNRPQCHPQVERNGTGKCCEECL